MVMELGLVISGLGFVIARLGFEVWGCPVHRGTACNGFCFDLVRFGQFLRLPGAQADFTQV